ncbi:pyridoxamine 5'-phosphate oxidase family protein [Fusobacterium sp. PH5-44]|uniref:pyridoxamine 5'-phosphate oxidase family protein n=1 Tax=unclassified Fusobacterium TaxID=2648384 RepID=UPI003D23FB06
MSIKDRVLDIINLSKIAMFGTVDENGNPYIKAMLLAKNDAINSFWFCSNTSSKRRVHIMKNPNTCLYFYKGFDGVMLTGKAEISYDDKMRLEFWDDNMYYHYPQGPKDPDYMLIKFTTSSGNFYSQKKNEDFEI